MPDVILKRLGDHKHAERNVKQDGVGIHARKRHKQDVSGNAENAEIGDDVGNRPKLFLVDLRHTFVRHIFDRLIKFVR